MLPERNSMLRSILKMDDTKTYRYSHSNTNEQHISPKINRHSPGLMSKLIIQPPSNSTSQTKRQRHTGQANADGHFPIADEEAQIDLEADEEEKKYESQIGDEREVRHGGGGEYGVCEAWDSSHHRRAQQDAADDFGNDAGLADFGEGPVEKATEDDDDTRLDALLGSCLLR
jgi:hypothetical protein